MRVLVVEDDPNCARAVARVLRADGGTVTIARTLRGGAEQLVAAEFDGLIVDVNLPDGNGIDLLTAPRHARPEAVSLVLTGGELDSASLRLAHAGGARCLLKPAEPADIRLFARRARTLRMGGAERVAARIQRRCIEYGLTEAEADILARRAAGARRVGLALDRNAAIGTVNNQVKSLLAKTGDATLDEAVSRLLREALDE